jgi:signal transduction histidine kinase
VALLGAGLVHDLNNALGIIHQSVDLLELNAGNVRALQQQGFQRIRKATDGVAALGQRLLGFGRHRDDEPRGPLDLRLVVREFEPVLRLALPSRVRLDLEVGSTPLRIVGTLGHLEQTLLNLVVYAKDAIPGQGTITISLRQVGAWAELAVADTGMGLSEEARRRLFEPFFTTKGKGQGTGLGLASVRALLEADGGSIEASDVEGGGTCFRIRFPQAQTLISDGD